MLRHPALHFAVLGALLHVLVRLAAPSPEPAREPIRVTAEQVDGLAERFVLAAGRSPDPAALRALVDDEVERQILVREARRLGLDRGDRSIEVRLVQKMRFLVGDGEASDEALLARARALDLGREDLVVERMLEQKMRLLLMHPGAPERLTAEELRAYYAARIERYQRAPRIDLRHVGFSRDRRGEAGARRDAEALARRLAAGGSVDRSTGDPSALGRDLRGAEPAKLEAVYGTGFVRGLEACGVGAWCGPFASGFGWHVARIERRRGGGPLPFEEVREQVARSVAADRREQRLRAALERLRAAYSVELPAALRRADRAMPRESGDAG